MPTEIELLNRLINIKDYVIDLTTTESMRRTKVRFFMVPQRTAICNHCGVYDQVKIESSVRILISLVSGAEIWIYKRRVNGVRTQMATFIAIREVLFNGREAFDGI